MSLQADTPRLVLASASVTRRTLLAAAGLRVEARTAQVDEALLKQEARAEGLRAEDTALRLAEAKARHIASGDPEALVIGCDQMLVCEDRWFDKPADLAEAATQLRALRGHTHTLVTAVACLRGSQRLWHDIACPRLTMRGFSDAFIEEYLRFEGAHVTTTVGAYRLEGPGVQLFSRVEGEHAAILGLPLLPLLGFLRQQGVVLD
ncbi:Nucleoside triphosphate pyrophosphatase [Rhodovastum atsumiense]|uniref:Nucleoside triphosphate pyrophosphatase n=1 Tax=Rhodovastum atsumiense TaxID=504468 RepID=A0A5M6IKW5_9PROT|nr:nucleoside triphosphate pyrophosphatase [Rhodovastum atsumiense]KAA5608822.1 Maf-like protein [Rhodovastum atsumiense]CAH2600828.1 Nucleoside triphosphate pyrophosphatase [Rhodovastum atsumiense]